MTWALIALAILLFVLVMGSDEDDHETPEIM